MKGLCCHVSNFKMVKNLAVLFLVHITTILINATTLDDDCDSMENLLTTGAGAPVDYRDTRGLNKDLFINEHYVHDITHLVRERIPQRVVHANGAGCFGYFKVTNDITNICKADMFSEVGKITPIAMRFSPVFVDKGGLDTTRGARGYAVKFYTQEGNLDIAGFSTPIFAIKDPVKVASLVHALTNSPVTGYINADTVWDFATLNPEIAHIFLCTFGDSGIPKGYQYMAGFGIHTFEVVNAEGVPSFVRLEFTPDAGVQNLFNKEAGAISARDPDYFKRSLYTSIQKGNYPSWTLNLQILSLEDVHNATFDVFDVTKRLPLCKYPLKPVGRLVLNRNPVNYFADVEQIAFNPASMVPGMKGSPDKLFAARRMAYRDAQYYRLGSNFENIRVNCPIYGANNYARDGVPPLSNTGPGPNYFPNTFNGPEPYEEKNRVELLNIVQDDSDNFEQAAELYNEMTQEERVRLIENLVLAVAPASSKIQNRVVKMFGKVHPDLGLRLKLALREYRISKKFGE